MTDKNHNSKAVLNHAKAAIHRHIAKIGRADRESLEEHRKIGAKLNEVREVVAWKDVLAWADEEFDFGKTWVARLMWVDREWEKWVSANDWAGDRRDTKGARSRHSPDGAFLLVREWEAANSSKEQDAGPPESKRRDSAKLRLERDLAVARRRIEQLEAEMRANHLEPPPPEPDSEVTAVVTPDEAEVSPAEALPDESNLLRVIDIESPTQPDRPAAAKPQGVRKTTPRAGIKGRKRVAKASPKSVSQTRRPRKS
ncbi:hypothetical protein [Falsiroseomonas sp. E2-1-a20]|uniref:hypothetical protein n=1 Tax=Falsiroseomonas sp. E2-1-a20 TaxID=3239300 RepID=UPI003F333D2E